MLRCCNTLQFMLKTERRTVSVVTKLHIQSVTLSAFHSGRALGVSDDESSWKEIHIEQLIYVRFEYVQRQQSQWRDQTSRGVWGVCRTRLEMNMRVDSHDRWQGERMLECKALSFAPNRRRRTLGLGCDPTPGSCSDRLHQYARRDVGHSAS